MKAMFILGCIFYLISLGYLGFFVNKAKHYTPIFKIKNFILGVIFPSVCILTIVFSVIYFIYITKDFFYIFILLICSFGIFLFTSSMYQEQTYLFQTIFIIICIGVKFWIFLDTEITIDTKQINETITIYDKSVINEDLSGIIFNITGIDLNGKSTKSLMQISSESFKKFDFDTELYITEFKLTTPDDCKLLITQNEVTTTNFLDYHGFMIIKPTTTISDTEYTLYICSDYIVYE